MIERTEYMEFLKKLKDKQIIKVVTGIRRCGKSTLLNMYKDYLKKTGINDEQIISINFEDPNEMIYDDWKELYNNIEKKLIKNKKNYIFLDEVQKINGFENVVDGLYIKDNVDIYITGSNSYMLSSELATYLTGRYMEIHMLPLSFKEFYSAYNFNNENQAYQKYIEYGGFPYLINLDNDESLISNYLDGIYNTILMKDVVSRNKVNDITLLESVNNFLFDNIGQFTSINKISNTLNSNNRSNSVNTIENYARYILDSYLMYRVPRYDIKGKELLKTNEKYYACDIGLRKHIIGGIRDAGSILENIIYLELKRRNYNIYVGKFNDKKIDFVIKNNDDLKYIQVSLSVRDEKTLKRELEPLEVINDNYPKYIITLDYDTLNYNGIKQISALDFLLGRIDI